jgi:hypothetical protein
MPVGGGVGARQIGDRRADDDVLVRVESAGRVRCW